MTAEKPTIRGRGTAENPANPFEKIALRYEGSDDWPEEEGFAPSPKTDFLRDHAKSIIATNHSPDVFFSASLNPYRGCEHGCIYCYARPTHRHLGYSAARDFETKIFVKENAADLLRDSLSNKSWSPQVLGFSGVTDCYQPIEKRLKITRRCLEVLAEFRNPCVIVTKNHLVTRDLDLLKEMNRYATIGVMISVTTLDPDLARKMEPRTSQPKMRLQAIETLAKGGIPVGVLVAPIIPGLTDHETPTILDHAAQAGAIRAGYTILRLPDEIKDLFPDWLEEHFPLRRQKILSRIRDVRGGKLNESNFNERMKGEGLYAEQIKRIFLLACQRLDLKTDMFPLTTEHFTQSPYQQLSLPNKPKAPTTTS